VSLRSPDFGNLSGKPLVNTPTDRGCVKTHIDNMPFSLMALFSALPP
jgi:hypothetical protein